MSDKKIIDVLPSEEDVANLRQKIAAHRRQQEHRQLQAELQHVAVTRANTHNQFDGVMQEPDTQRVLKTKRRRYSFIDLVFARLAGMFAARPIIGHLIAVGFALSAYGLLQTELMLHHAAQYHQYLGIGLLFMAGIAVIKSATRSALLPVILAIGGAIISHTLHHKQLLFNHDATFYQYVMIAGIIGMGITALNID